MNCAERVFARGPVLTSRPTCSIPRRAKSYCSALADELDITAGADRRLLFSDRPAEYLLTDAGPEWTPDALIARYNLELARGVLYWASRMTD